MTREQLAAALLDILERAHDNPPATHEGILRQRLLPLLDSYYGAE